MFTHVVWMLMALGNARVSRPLGLHSYRRTPGRRHQSSCAQGQATSAGISEWSNHPGTRSCTPVCNAEGRIISCASEVPNPHSQRRQLPQHGCKPPQRHRTVGPHSLGSPNAQCTSLFQIQSSCVGKEADVVARRGRWRERCRRLSASAPAWVWVWRRASRSCAMGLRSPCEACGCECSR